jgi:hypothetical protein
LNNPILASSEATGHSASLGNDGNVTTFWKPQDGDTNPWWQVDLERAVTMGKVKITFPAEGHYRFKVETSSDGEHWVLAADQSQTTSSEKIRTEVFTREFSGHLLRVTFFGEKAGVAEVEIFGRLTAQ